MYEECQCTQTHESQQQCTKSANARTSKQSQSSPRHYMIFTFSHSLRTLLTRDSLKYLGRELFEGVVTQMKRRELNEYVNEWAGGWEQ